jgi:hypothetical protein
MNNVRVHCGYLECGHGTDFEPPRRIFSRVQDRLRLYFSKNYRGVRCRICTTMQNNAQLSHARITHCAKVFRYQSGNADISRQDASSNLNFVAPGGATSAASTYESASAKLVGNSAIQLFGPLVDGYTIPSNPASCKKRPNACGLAGISYWLGYMRQFCARSVFLRWTPVVTNNGPGRPRVRASSFSSFGISNFEIIRTNSFRFFADLRSNRLETFPDTFTDVNELGSRNANSCPSGVACSGGASPNRSSNAVS